MTFRSLLKKNADTISMIQRLVDPLLVLITGTVVYAIRFGSFEIPEEYIVILIGICLICLAIFPFFDLYRPRRDESLWSEIQTLTKAWFIVYAVLVGIMFATKTSTEYSRVWITGLMIGGLSSMTLFRLILRSSLRFLRRRGINTRNIVIAGAGELGREVAQRITASHWTGLKIIGFYDDAPHFQGQLIEGVPVRGSLQLLPKEATGLGVNQVWIALPLNQDTQVKSMVAQLNRLPVQITFVPDIYGVHLLNHSIGEIAGLPVIHIMETPLSGINGFIKELEDKILAISILLAASPLMLLIILGIKLSSPGPVFYKQLRGGMHGERIWVWKFRTMKHHSEPPEKIFQAVPGDARITPFGTFLRRTSLDELPQFLNVLKGDMSIVGPRPHAVEHDHFYQQQIDTYILRHQVKPGLTGWAQVNGWRGETGEIRKMENRIRHDIYYINNWSLWFDLRIIVKTVFIILTGKNAH
ncbi:undecaprenyl-phosphate glucose phosphotransferase [Candidatus Nitrotoga fabula]|uniref:UDP-glucose:undecaprenyl-phosphate glucose-1-phosphate transferase n=1 Tax=Candidatus Nitrotoga fabula TaxID=2182327 RepID=A0A916BBQ4_9PROT|nr:undecaprenyl-phosphate glucose phosphotransferase [Candidatus Nitrotoga fabula]CAE6687389.1 UDP-glucose:undecaprenyl-phosphate glucose-1-phosphate transferase [Candidatus Nitrotoga fabula]